MASYREAQIKAAVVPLLQQRWPSGVVLNEVRVSGGGRADLAVVTEAELVLVEIKSSGDSLERWAFQRVEYRKAAHRVILVLDEKFGRVSFRLENGGGLTPVLRWKDRFEGADEIWITKDDSQIVHRFDAPVPSARVNWRQRAIQPCAVVEMLRPEELLLLARNLGFPQPSCYVRKRLPEILTLWIGKRILADALALLRGRPAGRGAGFRVVHHGAVTIADLDDAAGGKSDDLTGQAVAA